MVDQVRLRQRVRFFGQNGRRRLQQDNPMNDPRFQIAVTVFLVGAGSYIVAKLRWPICLLLAACGINKCRQNRHQENGVEMVEPDLEAGRARRPN